MYTVGHLQVPKTLAFKIKLSEKNFAVQISVICMRIKHSSLYSLTIKYRVHQGSVLAPLPFSVDMNKTPNNLSVLSLTRQTCFSVIEM